MHDDDKEKGLFEAERDERLEIWFENSDYWKLLCKKWVLAFKTLILNVFSVLHETKNEMIELSENIPIICEPFYLIESWKQFLRNPKRKSFSLWFKKLF